MTALLLFGLLVAGGTAYVSWARHGVEHGVAAWWYVLGAPVAYLAPVALLVAACLVLSWLWRSPRPPAARLSLDAGVRLFVAEMLAVAASWPQIALHRFLLREPAPAPAARPVILVHGVLVNDGMWFDFRRRLARSGVGAVYTLNYGPPYADIERYAAQLAAKIEAVRHATGAARVAVVGHSMGGLVARAYVRRWGTGAVDRLITIGTPHHGSLLAWLVPGRCLAQMRPGNRWLADLNAVPPATAVVPTLSLWSRHDTMVVPQASSELPGADNVALVGIGHNALLHDAEVFAIVLRELTASAARTSG
jgi:triacylglycerol esterase/lipase EstA (alpha/beta hydrolase family)